MKKCIKCGIEGEVPVEFYRNGGNRCKECQRDYDRKRRKEIYLERGERYKRIQHRRNIAQLKNLYKLSNEEAENLLKKSKCDICGNPELRLNRLSVDHDHKCCPGKESCGKCIRGFICNGCNRGLGFFNDDIRKLKKAIRYLEGNINEH